MNSAQALEQQTYQDRSDLVMHNIDLEVTCDVTIETIEEAAIQLLLSPNERDILDQAISVLAGISVHHSTIIGRLAHGTKG